MSYYFKSQFTEINSCHPTSGKAHTRSVHPAASDDVLIKEVGLATHRATLASSFARTIVSLRSRPLSARLCVYTDPSSLAWLEFDEMDPLFWVFIGLLVAFVFFCSLLVILEMYLKKRAEQVDLVPGGGAGRRGRGEPLRA